MIVHVSPSASGDDTGTFTGLTTVFGEAKAEILRADFDPGNYQQGTHSSVLAIDARNVRHLAMEGAVLNDFSVAARDVVIDGGYVKIDPSTLSAGLRALVLSGNHNRVRGFRVSIAGTAFTAVYVSDPDGISCDFNQFTDLDLSTGPNASMIFTGSKYNEVRGGFFQGLDDGISLKAVNRDCEHFLVQGATFTNTGNVLGIGSDIGYRPTDTTPHVPRTVRNVTAVGIVCDRTSQILNLKPGGIDYPSNQDAYNWREGTVENVLVADVVHSDPVGEKFTRLATFVSYHGGTIRDVTLSGVRAWSRCQHSSAAQRLFFIQGGVTSDDTLTLRNVLLRDIEYTDPLGGALYQEDPVSHAVIVPGHSIESVFQFAGYIDMDEFNVVGLRVEGINGNFLRADSSVLGKMRLEDIVIRPGANGAIGTPIVKAPNATYTVMKNWRIDIPDVGTRSFNIGGKVVGEEHPAALGDVPAGATGTSWKTIPFVVPKERHAWIVNARVVVSAVVAASTTDYATLTLRNATRNLTITTLSTAAGIAANKPTCFSASNLVTNSAMCNRGDVIELQVAQTGTIGVALADLNLVLEYVPF
jgi:hypothetical protein